MPRSGVISFVICRVPPQVFWSYILINVKLIRAKYQYFEAVSDVLQHAFFKRLLSGAGREAAMGAAGAGAARARPAAPPPVKECRNLRRGLCVELQN
jgi:hypothetical protein